ncbi:MAG: DoxX family protein [Fibrobacterales bacterium]
MNKRDRIIYWVVTGLFSAMILMSVVMYITQNTMVSETFVRLGYPVYIVYPLALLKALGILAILTKKSPLLKEWAYAGFFFDFILAAAAHSITDGAEYEGAFMALVLLLASYVYDRKVYGIQAPTVSQR